MAIKFIKSDAGYEQGRCPVSVIELNGFSPDKIVNNITYSDDIYENSTHYHQTVKLDPIYPDDDNSQIVSGFLIQYYEVDDEYSNKYLVTEKTNTLNNPVYFTYELKYDVYGITDSDMLEIYKNNETKILPSDYIVEFGDVTLTDNYYGDQSSDFDRYASGVVWNTFDSTQDIHRVRVLLPIEFFNESSFYTIRYNKSLFNITTPTHTELMEIESIYNQDEDFYIDDNYIRLTDDSLIPNTSVTKLYIIKDPETHINAEGIFSIDGQSYQNDAETSWNVRINTGKFVRNGDYQGADKKAFTLDFVQTDPSYGGRYQLMSYVKPKILGGNVIKIDEKPMYVESSNYVYPNYEIDVFPKPTEDTLIPTGTIGFDIDGVNVTDIGVSSIDRKKGYLLTNKQFTSDQDITMFFYIDTSEEMYVRNLELNPRLSGLYGFSSDSSEKNFTNIGIAIRKQPDDGLSENPLIQRTYLYPYFFDFDNIGDFYQGSPIPTSSSTTIISGDLLWNPYSTDSDPDGEFLPIAHLSVNRLTPEILKIRDARVFGGGLNKEKRLKLHNEELNSYMDVGYYDGEALPFGGTIIIHLPSTVFPGLITRWENSDLFNPDLYTDLSVDEIAQLEATGERASGEYEGYYNKLLQGITADNDPVNIPYYAMRNQWARREASHYLDQLIKKYIDAGTQYILLDESFNEIVLDV